MTARPRLVIASNNPGKVREFRELLGHQVDIVTMADLGLESPPETEPTFAGNAELKARYLFDRANEVTLADDSGLEIDALDGAPGVLSARYAGEPSDDAANRQLVLEKLAGSPPGSRGARFVAAIVVIDRQGVSTTVEGTCEGSIGLDERGANGFGYDSLFVLADGRTMAELSSSQKGDVSHRGQAVRKLLPTLESALGLNRTASRS